VNIALAFQVGVLNCFFFLNSKFVCLILNNIPYLFDADRIFAVWPNTALTAASTTQSPDVAPSPSSIRRANSRSKPQPMHVCRVSSPCRLCTIYRCINLITRDQLWCSDLIQESPADAVKPARRKSMPKLLQFDVFRFISPNSISPNCQFIASRGRPMFSQALGLYSCTQFEIWCLPIIKFLVQIAST